MKPIGSTASRIAAVLSEVLETITRDEDGRILSAAEVLADRVVSGGLVYAFGAGHAQAFAMELHSRAGGLDCFRSMSLEDLRSARRPFALSLSDSEPERVAANGPRLLAHHGVGDGDALVIASNSGRNSAPIEMAMSARERGIPIVAVVSFAHAQSVGSRHPSGMKLHEVCDMAIDSHVPAGDASVSHISGRPVGAASTVAFAAIAQVLNGHMYDVLARLGSSPRPIVSANV